MTRAGRRMLATPSSTSAPTAPPQTRLPRPPPFIVSRSPRPLRCCPPTRTRCSRRGARSRSYSTIAFSGHPTQDRRERRALLAAPVTPAGRVSAAATVRAIPTVMVVRADQAVRRPCAPAEPAAKVAQPPAGPDRSLDRSDHVAAAPEEPRDQAVIRDHQAETVP